MKQDVSTTRVAPYARISDSDEQRAPGLDRQLRTVMPLIASRGGEPTHEYVDYDKSAFKEDVIRDEGLSHGSRTSSLARTTASQRLTSTGFSGSRST